MLRVVVREDFTYEMASDLISDIRASVDWLDHHFTYTRARAAAARPCWQHCRAGRPHLKLNPWCQPACRLAPRLAVCGRGADGQPARQIFHAPRARQEEAVKPQQETCGALLAERFWSQTCPALLCRACLLDCPKTACTAYHATREAGALLPGSASALDSIQDLCVNGFRIRAG